MKTKTSMRIDEVLLAKIDARTNEALSRTAVLERDLERYYNLLQQTKQALQSAFSQAEWQLVFDACQTGEGNARLLWAKVENGIRRDGLAQKWQIDNPEELINRLLALSDLELDAIQDAAWLYRKYGQIDPSTAMKKTFEGEN